MEFFEIFATSITLLWRYLLLSRDIVSKRCPLDS